MDQQPKWKYGASIYLKQKHILVFRDNDLGLQMQVISPISSFRYHSRELYFVDGDNRAYTTEAKALKALASGPNDATGGRHPLYIQCVPGSARSETSPRHFTSRFPALLQQGQGWFAALAHRLSARALQAGDRFPLHRPSR